MLRAIYAAAVCVCFTGLVLFVASGMPIGGEFQVNTITSLFQDSASVAVDADGNFIVVWLSADTPPANPNDIPPADIKGQRYDSAGTPLAGEFLVNTYTTGHQFEAQVAAEADGDFIVVWTNLDPLPGDLSSRSVHARRYASSGAAIGAQFQVNTYTTSIQERAEVGIDAAGNFVIVWESAGSTGDDTISSSIQGQRYDSAGIPLSGQFQVNMITASAQSTPGLAVDDNGNFVVAWRSLQGTFDIAAQRFDSNGLEIGTEFQVNTYTTSVQSAPEIDFDPNSNFVIVWESFGATGDTSGNSIQGQRYDSTGAPLGGQFQVNTSTDLNQIRPWVETDASGNFVVVWSSRDSAGNDNSSYSVQGQIYDSVGDPVGSEFQINTYTTSSQNLPDVAVAPNGDFVVAWHSIGSTGTDQSYSSIQARRFQGPLVQPLRLAVSGFFSDGDEDGFAQPGETVIFSYQVTNDDPAQALTNVGVSDPTVGTITCPSGNPILSLPAGGSETCTGVYTLTQADVDAGRKDTTGTTDSDQTSAITSNGSAILPQNPAINLVKDGAFDPGPNGAVDVGDAINYTFDITNSGNVTLSDVTITDIMVSPITCAAGHPITTIAPGQTETCTGIYLITQADVDAGVKNNTATVTADDPQGGQVNDLDVHGELIPRTPFICTGEAFIVQNVDAELAQVDQTTSPFSFLQVAGPTGREINNLGFRRTDGLLYAVELSASGNNQLVQIDATGAVFGIGRPAGLPSNIRFDGGDVSADGSTLYVTSNNSQLYLVDLDTLTVTSVAKTGATGFVFDWAFNPIDGLLYGGDSSNGQLAVLDPATGVRTDVGVSGLPSGDAYGGAWFNAAGQLFLYRNSGEIYQIDLAGPTVVDVQTGPSSSRNDGAACVQDVLGVAKNMSSTLDGLPETITIDYVVENLSGTTALSDLSAPDDLTVTFGAHGVDWTFTSIASSPAGLADPSFDGHTDLELIAAGQGLAAGTSATVTVTLELLTFDAQGAGGEFCNQVRVTGDAGGTIFGDLSTRGSDPDPDGNGSPDERQPSCVNPTVPPAPSFDLVKTGALDLGGDGLATPGDLITYTFTFTNTGNVPLDNVILSDPLVPVITCPSGNPIVTFPVGATEVCTGTYAIVQADIDAGVVNNTATLDATFGGSPLSVQASHSEVVPDPAGGPSPFACTGDAYIIQNQNAQLTVIDQSVSPFVFVPIGGATGREINNLGFNAADGLLYGVELSSSGNVQILQIDATGAVFDLGRPGGLPTGPRFDAGDVSPDGTVMYITANNQPLYRLDLTALPALPAVTSVSVSGASGFVFDWAVNPFDGLLYGGDSTSGQLAVLDPTTGVRTDFNVAGLPSGSGYGGAWFDNTGTLFLYQNSGVIYEIDLAGPTVVNTQTGPGATRNDGAACIDLAPPAAAVSLVKTGALDQGPDGESSVGDLINYTFDVTNDGTDPLTNVTLSDPMIASFTCPGGHPIASLAPGATVTCTGTYAITQADIDARVKDNTATVTADGTGGPVNAQDSHSEPIPAPPGAGPAPFACTGDAYIIQNQNAQLTVIDQSVSPFVFVPIGSATGREINNLGFRSTDGLLYGVELNSSGNVQILQIDATGAVLDLGRPAGLPTGPRFDAGDVSPDGDVMYITSNNQPLYRLDLTSVPTLPAVTSVSVSGATGFVFDWAVNPFDGMLYGGDSSQGQLAILDPATGVRSDVNVAGLPSGSGYGGAWFDAAGTLFLYQNSGILYEIDLAGPTVVDTQTGPGATRNDGAACIDLAPPQAGVSLDKTGALDLGGDGISTVGDLINYTFQITNTGLDPLTNVTLSDPMIAAFTCPSGHPIANLASGASETCTGSYAITQADIDAGVKNNTADVTANGGAVTDQDSHGETIPAPPIVPTPFACTGDAYIVQNQNAQLTLIDQSVSPFVFVNIGSATGTEINNLGFRKTDGFLYGVELSSSGNLQILQIDSNGNIFGLGRPSGLPSGPRFDAGDVTPDGTAMYITSNNQRLYRLDLTSVPTLPAVTSVAVTGASGFVFDWAVSPVDGLLYGGDSTSGQLAVLNPTTGVRTDFNVAGLPSGSGYGGAWFDSAGTLFLYQNSGILYEIDLAGPTVVNTQTGPGASRNDGAACIP